MENTYFFFFHEIILTPTFLDLGLDFDPLAIDLNSFDTLVFFTLMNSNLMNSSLMNSNLMNSFDPLL